MSEQQLGMSKRIFGGVATAVLAAVILSYLGLNINKQSEPSANELPKTKIPYDVNTTKSPQLSPEQAKEEAKRIADKWILAYLRKDERTLGVLSHRPFYCFDEELKLSIDVAACFRKMFREEDIQKLDSNDQDPNPFRKNVELAKRKGDVNCKVFTIYEGFSGGWCTSEVYGRPLPTLQRMQLEEHRDIVAVYPIPVLIRTIGLPDKIPKFCSYILVLYFRCIDEDVQLVSYYLWESNRPFDRLDRWRRGESPGLFPRDN